MGGGSEAPRRRTPSHAGSQPASSQPGQRGARWGPPRPPGAGSLRGSGPPRPPSRAARPSGPRPLPLAGLRGLRARPAWPACHVGPGQEAGRRGPGVALGAGRAQPPPGPVCRPPHRPAGLAPGSSGWGRGARGYVGHTCWWARPLPGLSGDPQRRQTLGGREGPEGGAGQAEVWGCGEPSTEEGGARGAGVLSEPRRWASTRREGVEEFPCLGAEPKRGGPREGGHPVIQGHWGPVGARRGPALHLEESVPPTGRGPGRRAGQGLGQRGHALVGSGRELRGKPGRGGRAPGGGRAGGPGCV